MNNNLNIEEKLNLDVDTELEEKKLEIFLSFAFLAVWILSILILYNQN